MDYGISDSSGTDDDLPPSLQNRFQRGGHPAGNRRSAVAGSAALPRLQIDMETQIHHIEQEAYVSVLRAFKAQSDAITWDKESLITELRKELRVTDEEHRVLLSRVNSEDVIRRISSESPQTNQICSISKCNTDSLLNEGDTDSKEQKNECDSRPDGLKTCKSSMPASGSTSRWKSILNSIAKQVSEVPLSLSIRVSSLRGTVRLHIKSPPTNHLWFGFSSMPDIEFDLQSSVGDHKITSGHIASFLINRFKASIRDNMVLPNCESISIPWMLAEKDNWVPRKAAPFVWLDQDVVDVPEASGSQPWEVKKKTEPTSNEENHETESFAAVDLPIVKSNESSSDLTMPLLSSEEHQAKSQHDTEENHECRSTSRCGC